MRRHRLISLLTLLLAFTVAAFADEITGTVTNATTGKPAGGVSVTLVDPMGGMAEVASAKANAQGQFSFNAPAANGPRLARAERSGVNYFKMIPPGTNTVELSVYDASPSVQGIRGTADVVRLQAESGTLQADEMFALDNNSQPPRTLNSPSTFEFTLPDGAQIDEARAEAPNGQPITVEPKATSQKNHYAFAFALKPGETRLQISYHLPYSGQVSFAPRLTRDFQHYVVVTPVGMTFSPKDAKQFQGMDAQQPGANVQVSMGAKEGQEIAYSISGTGTYPADQSQAAAAGGMASANGREDSRPGGGLGRPIDAPDALAKYRWFILAALMAILVGGGIWAHERNTLEAAAAANGSVPVARAGLSSAQPERAAAPAATAGNALLGALKEEIFALEVDHQQGKLSQAEYDKARAALEQTLQRALARLQS